MRGSWTTPAELVRSLLRARDLTITLARKDFFVRYRRAAFGVSWAVALPLLQALVLSVVLNRVSSIEVEHFAVFILSGVVAWSFFGVSVSTGSTAIVDNAALSSRIWFPRAVLPLSVCLANLFSLAVSVLILLGLATAVGVPPGLHTLLLVPAVALLLAVTASLTLVLSALHVSFRDTRYAVQAALFVWFYVTPVFYPLTLLSGGLRVLVTVNPVTGPVELFHAAALGAQSIDTLAVASACGWTVVLLAAALALHCRGDRVFADLL